MNKVKYYKNVLGHDNKSEIVTIIARLREKKFNILSYSNNSIKFEIVLVNNYIVGSVTFKQIQKIKYIIQRYSKNNIYNYYIEQLNGVDNRFISSDNGYIIWYILEETAHN